MIQIAGDGQNGTTPFGLNGIGNPFNEPPPALSWTLTAPQPAVTSTSSYVTTSGILAEDEYPQFASSASARWAKPGGPFDPHTGSKYVFSQLADVSYKRLTRTISVPASGNQSLSFWTSHETEEHWDFMAVEAHTPGQDDWTTLPDANGHTTQDTGESCPAGWFELHPFLEHYQTLNADGTCSPTGTSGSWNAASGSSNGWQQWSVDLSKWAGKDVEVSISYVSDWSTQGLGVFLDDVTLPDGTSTSFESGALDGWTLAGPPAGSGSNANDWEVIDAGGFPVGAAITTPKSLLFGFGFEGVSSQAERNAVMDRVVDHLLG